jgi:formylglycine-generating enzyme required for sulfatase activity
MKIYALVILTLFINPLFFGQINTVPESSKLFVVTELNLDLEMVFVQGGEFVMGCLPGKDKKCVKNELPPHEKAVADFYIGKFEITQDQWKIIMGSLPDRFDGCGQCPIVDVSWHDIQFFLRKLNELTGKLFRLPSEAEWEFAAKGGVHAQGFSYSGSDILDDVAWFADNSNQKTNPVGTKQPNELGLFDMTGNVWEWCEDRYGLYENRSIPMAKREDIGIERVTRGGACDSFHESCRVVFRSSANPDARSFSLGFRVAMSAE